MIVVDSSAVLELLLNTSAAAQVAMRIRQPEQTLHAPHLMDLEVVQTLRRYVRSGEMPEGRAREALEDFCALPIERYPHDAFLDRIWQWRNNVTAYDAAYLALAEVLEAPLLTCDAAFGSFRRHRARIELI
jgi:predicted nucleic acid-binding protein